jgi:type IV pilus assembly protein PilB
VLVRSGALTEEQLGHALAQQAKNHHPLGELLIKLGYISDEKMRQALARQLRISFVDLDGITIDKQLAKAINSAFARRHALVPIARIAQTLTVCMSDPTQRTVVDDLKRVTGLTVTVVTASPEAIRRAHRRLYGDTGQVPAGQESVDLLVDDVPDTKVRSRYVDEQLKDKRADVLVRQLLTKAVTHRASDLHLETLSTRMQVRFRIDGMLETLDLGSLQDACDASAREIVARLKILARLDIAERRRPQDGGFRVRVDRGSEQSDIDLRVSVVPSYYGESVVLRLLDRKRAPQTIDQLTFPARVAEKWRQLLQRPSGILLVTGPTGAGKSTTLYASLMTLYRPQIRVLTAEDPIEYVYEQFSQSEVNLDIGNTFATYLRAFLRHDPEVIMVGEIRDEETAEMSFRAAQTGHLLLSTLHTETAIAAVPRLRDLGIDSNSMASSLAGVLGQRLVRRVCGECQQPYQPPADVMREFFATRPDGLRFVRGSGCRECNYTGYRGRLTMVELWTPDDEDVLLITKEASFEQIRTSARRSTLAMSDCMLNALKQGHTNLEELVRVLPPAAIAQFRHSEAASLAATA